LTCFVQDSNALQKRKAEVLFLFYLLCEPAQQTSQRDTKKKTHDLGILAQMIVFDITQGEKMEVT
jgi:hypothetical protein